MAKKIRVQPMGPGEQNLPAVPDEHGVVVSERHLPAVPRNNRAAALWLFLFLVVIVLGLMLTVVRG